MMQQIDKYRVLALSGVVLMAVGSMLACLGLGPWAMSGDIALLLGMAVSGWGFSVWHP
ncbi:hypothetical protein [Shewanella sp. NFH-SH190041]|uniref:hypothetical protein n=1 Tax=Shewanella sp. NFH-SH190041 TaxID=2950245 RepID=UPI0021C2F7CD|nr:hypothetical protein [Shewanella sp. NFH-SH190041]